jgi:AraC-like DNA-binding protein
MSKAASAAGSPPSVGHAAFTFRTDGLPERDRVAITREEFGRNVMRVDIEPMPKTRFHMNVMVRSAPGLDFASLQVSSLRVTRSTELLSDGDDRVILQFGAQSFARQFGREMLLNSGDAILLSNSDAGSVTYPSPASIDSLFLPRNALGSSLRDVDGCLTRPIARDTPALRLLRQYLDILKDQSALGTHQLQQTIVTHVHDLTALALGATGDAKEVAKGRGFRAAHLQAIKKIISETSDGGLSIDTIAARRGLTSRYVQRLFQDEGTTFTEFARDKRLDRAHAMLRNRRFDRFRISDIALEAGFGDLSYFHKQFRRRFGLSPTDVRAQSLGDETVD